MRKLLFLLPLFLVVLSACAQQPRAPDSRSGEPVPGPLNDVEVRAVPLDEDAAADLLYHLLVGEVAGQMGQLDLAVSHYVAAAMDSTDPEIAERATRIALFANRHEQALPAAQRWVSLAPRSMEGRQVLGALLVNAGDVEGAVEQLDYVVRSAPMGEAAAFGTVAHLLSRAQNRTAALATMEGLAVRFPELAQAHLALAQLALQMERPDLAQQAAERALSMDSGLHEARVLRAQALARQGHMDLALDGLRDAVASDPGHVQLGIAYGRLLIQAREFDAARREFERMIALRPDDADLLYTLGLLSIEVEQYADAESYLQRLLATGRRSHEANFYLGRIAETEDRPEEAIMRYHGVGDGDYFQEAQLRKALLMGRGGDVDEARMMLREFRRDAEDPEWRVRLYLTESQVLSDAREYGAAMEVLNQGLVEQPDSAQILYARALVAEKLDRLDILESDLRTILASDPDNSAALNALGYTLADRTDRLEEAYEYVKRAHALRPDDAAILDSMGWVLYRMGRYEEAETYLRRAYETMYDPEIASNLAALLWAQGNRDEAREVLNDALSKDPDHDRLLRVRDRLEQ
jgi:tetratricopeptide (TPR) repeat protein